MGSQSPAAILDAFLNRYPKVENIACQAVTYGNVVCTRFIPISRARALASASDRDHGENGLNVLHPLTRFYESSGTAFPQMELMTLGDDTWVPDWSSLRPSPHAAQATVQCYVVEPPASPNGGGGDLRQHDPREALYLAAAAAEQAGLEVKVGFEVEFVFLDPAAKVIPLPGSPLCLIASNNSRSPFRDVVFEAIKHLESAGVGIWGFHVENAGWELSSSPASPMVAVDNLVFIHETIKEVAYAHGLRVSFYPSHGDEHTLGQHLHLSINGSRVTGPTADAFLAGMLDRLPASTAFLNGGIDSYDPHRRFWCGSGTASWSHGKFAAIRRVSGSHFEIRLGDAMASAYLQLAVLLCTGLDGMQQKRALEVKSLDIAGFVEQVGQDVLDKAGIKEKLPTSLKEALDVLQKDLDGDQGLSKVMGKEIVGAYLIAKRYELEAQSKLDPKARREAVVQNI